MRKPLVLAIGALVAIWVGAHLSSGTTRQRVAGHIFDVPKDRLFNAAIAWLSAPSSDSFVFLLEPNPDPDRIPEHRILVEPLAGRCPGGVLHLMDVACGKVAELVGVKPTFERHPNGLGSWSSDLFVVYRMPTGTVRQMIASCQLFEPNPVQPRPMNMCTTVWSYKGLLLQFDFDEAEAPKVRAMKARAMALLDRWQVR